MSEDKQAAFRRWQDSMQFKSSPEALFKYHLPVLAVFISIVCSACIVIFANKQSVLSCVVVDVCLWLASFLFLRLGFVGKRDDYLKQHGRAAYRVAAFKFLLPYGALWLAAVTMPLWAPGERAIRLFPFSIIGLVVLVAGFFLMRKILNVFGIDRLIYLYTYFPEDATIVKLEIFEFIRHPAYAAWIYFGAAFFLIRGSWASLLCLAINFIAIYIVARAEEGDIIKDFKGDYYAYQNSVPCFFPKRPLAFVKFIFK
ncbi:MAG: methyltransferase [Candidatus Omnitrophica bacterium]|nr:methyltransferase [Candidatus Omnitrophota bacterium]